jgi:hypothetical protein
MVGIGVMFLILLSTIAFVLSSLPDLRYGVSIEPAMDEMDCLELLPDRYPNGLVLWYAHPVCSYQPSSCSEPVCVPSGNATICSKEVCEPVPSKAFDYIEVATIACFTAEYLTRALTVHAVPLAILNPLATEEQKMVSQKYALWE